MLKWKTWRRAAEDREIWRRRAEDAKAQVGLQRYRMRRRRRKSDNELVKKDSTPELIV
jgi:hypothetical protein